MIAILLAAQSSAVFAQGNSSFVRRVRSIETKDLNILKPAGLSYSPQANAFYVLSGRSPNQAVPANADLFLLTSTEKIVGTARIAAQIKDPINVTFDAKMNRLLIFKTPANQLIEVQAGSDGNLDPRTLTRFNVQHFGLDNPQGISIDPASGHLFILDAVGPVLVHVEPSLDGGFDNAVIAKLDLPPNVFNPRGLAFDTTTGHLHMLSPDTLQVFELTTTGQVMAVRDLTEFAIRNPQALAFAPSGDLTDDPGQMSLYIADQGIDSQQVQGYSVSVDNNRTDEEVVRSAELEVDTTPNAGQIIELSLVQPPAAQSVSNVATVIQTIDTSQFVPPSPDTSGIAYLPLSGTLLLSDSEVNELNGDPPGEPNLFTGDNLFEMTLAGVLNDTLTTISFSDEPTGVAYNPANGHLFFSDDTGDRSIYELNPGSDGLYDTPDDIITEFSTEDFSSFDPEGVAFDSVQGVLFIADGVNNEIYRVAPGPNGIFDGISPAGDDQVTNFDTATLGIIDPEGIAFDAFHQHLYIVGDPSTTLAQITTNGTLVRMIDTTAANAKNPAGLAQAPGSVVPTDMNIYMTARGVDNNTDPNENDGKVYELSFPDILGIPQMISPLGTSADSSPTFEWTPVAGATEYTLVVYDVTNDQIVLMPNYLATEVGCSGGTNNCTIQPAGLNLLAANYTWLVRASDGTYFGRWATYEP